MHLHDGAAVADVGPRPPPRVRSASGLVQASSPTTNSASAPPKNERFRAISHPLG
jgi:hypothetical protein